jgi:hypothetical protein
MNDTELENLYKLNTGESHYAGLRGVFDAGYALGAGSSTLIAQNTDPSLTATSAQVTPLDPTSIQTA